MIWCRRRRRRGVRIILRRSRETCIPVDHQLVGRNNTFKPTIYNGVSAMVLHSDINDDGNGIHCALGGGDIPF